MERNGPSTLPFDDEVVGGSLVCFNGGVSSFVEVGSVGDGIVVMFGSKEEG